MKKTAFTLIEVIIAVTILAVVMISVFEAYYGTVSIERRLNLARSLQENARSMTEILAKDVRESGIDVDAYGDPFVGPIDFENGNDVLAVTSSGVSVRYYLMEDSTTGQPVKCGTGGAGSGKCYLGRETPTERIRLTDDRVRVERLKFYLSGVPVEALLDGSFSGPPLEAKVTAAFELRIPDGKGLDPDLIKHARVAVQTTIAQKLYKDR